jgi:hypothetical protein
MTGRFGMNYTEEQLFRSDARLLEVKIGAGNKFLLSHILHFLSHLFWVPMIYKAAGNS